MSLPTGFWADEGDRWVHLRTGSVSGGVPGGDGESLTGIPDEGEGFLLGMYVSSMSSFTSLETAIGREFDATMRYRDSNAGTPWPLSEEQPIINRGNVFRYPLESRVFNYASYTPPAGVPAPGWDHVNPANGERYVGYTHAQIYNGQMDVWLAKVFNALKAQEATGTTFIVDWDHEMDDNRRVLANNTGDWGIITHNRSQAFSNPADPDPAEFIAAHRYMVEFARDMDVTNVLWGFCPAGWTLSRNSARLGELYPGDAWTDLIMWDPYNNSASNWRTFAQIVAPVYNAIDGGLFGEGAKTKARMLGEFGALTNDSRRATWITDIATHAQDLPKLRGALWFSSGTWGAIHGTDGTATERAALATLMDHPYLNDWKA